MRDLSVVDRPPTCKYSMTRTVLSIGRLRAPVVDGVVDGRVDWHAVALIRPPICGRMNQRLLQHNKGEKRRWHALPLFGTQSQVATWNILQHDLTQDDVEDVLLAPFRHRISRSSGRSIAFGLTATGRYIVVVYDKIDEYTVYPVTAYDV